MYVIKQIKICAEYRDMLPRPRLDLSGTPGSWQTSLGLGSMSRYSAQILICILWARQWPWTSPVCAQHWHCRVTASWSLLIWPMLILYLPHTVNLLIIFLTWTVAMDTNVPMIMCRTLICIQTLVKCHSRIGTDLVPYYRQIMPACARFKNKNGEDSEHSNETHVSCVQDDENTWISMIVFFRPYLLMINNYWLK